MGHDVKRAPLAIPHGSCRQRHVFDFSVKPRLSSERGNAILVASSIYEACKHFELFQKTPFRNKCALITSYNPNAQDITKEETGAKTDIDRQVIYNTYTELLKGVEAMGGLSKTEVYEEAAKALFTKEPANMKLLVVVDKLLTAFDAPPCTYVYIDTSMQTTACSKRFVGPIGLTARTRISVISSPTRACSRKVENAIAVYTSELDHSDDGPAPDVLLKDRLKKREKNVSIKPWNALSCFASVWSRRKENWNTSTSSAATPKSRQTLKSANLSARPCTRQPQCCCGRMLISRMKWMPQATTTPTLPASRNRSSIT
ncbi:hypothetical protein NKJ95_26420 [Mesorhizobium sp. M0012]|uniref:type I restriction enzyme subunit R domain-containing protein n=1 Tax=Mesorhizobium sp. M0012 TaxID=2956840 RepID=UPI00333D60E6